MTPFWIDSELHWHTGDVVRKVMIATDLSAKTVAERAGVDPRTVRAILKTGNYERNALQQIAAVWSLRAEDFAKDVPTASLLHHVTDLLRKAG